MPPLVAAVDVGSSTARAGLFDVHGHLIRRAEAPFATAHPITDHAEHSSDEIWRAVCRAVRQALADSGASPEDVKGLAFDATCSLVMLDRSGSAGDGVDDRRRRVERRHVVGPPGDGRGRRNDGDRPSRSRLCWRRDVA